MNKKIEAATVKLAELKGLKVHSYSWFCGSIFIITPKDRRKFFSHDELEQIGDPEFQELYKAAILSDNHRWKE